MENRFYGSLTSSLLASIKTFMVREAQRVYCEQSVRDDVKVNLVRSKISRSGIFQITKVSDRCMKGIVEKYPCSGIFA